MFAITEMQRKHEPKAYAGLAGISIVGALCARVAAVTERHRAPAAALRLAAPDVDRVVTAGATRARSVQYFIVVIWVMALTVGR